MVTSCVKTAFRNLRRHKSYSLVILSGLVLAMVSCIYIGLWVQNELAWDGFHQNYDRLYRIIANMEDGWHDSTPLALVPSIRGKYPEIEQATRFSSKNFNIRSGDTNVNRDGALVDRDFFSMFSFPFSSGGVPRNFNESRSIVVSERLAKLLFHNGNPIGKSLVVNHDQKFVITGVVRDVPRNSHLQFDFLLPVVPMRRGADTDWSYDCMSYVALNAEIRIQDFEAKIAPFIRENDTSDLEVAAGIQPLGKIHLHSLNGTDPIVYLYIFMGLGLIILLIASVNFINIFVSRSVYRAKEIGIRKVVGARKKDIVRQFMGESVTLSLIALLVALVGAMSLSPLLNRVSGKQISPEDFFTLYNILGALGLALITGLLSGFYPALLLSHTAPAETVKGRIQYSERGRILRRVFVSFQFVITVVLIVTTLTMYRQLTFMADRDLGFNKDQVVAIPLNNQLSENYSVLKETLVAHRDIEMVTSAYNNPTDIRHTNSINWEGNRSGNPISIKDQSIDYDYFDLFGMKIVQGRRFGREFPDDIRNFILNESAVKLTGLDSPIGKLITVWTTEGKIVGVVKDFHSTSLHQKIKPIVFMLSERHGRRTRMFVKINSHNMTATLAYIKRESARFAPNHPFEYAFLDDEFASQYTNDRRLGSLYRLFTLLAILISCLGLYSLVSSVLAGKTKEIGIRKVLGSTVLRIMSLVSREFLILIVLSTLIGWPLSYLIIKKILNNYAYQAPIGVWIFLAAGLIILILATLTMSSRVFRAARANPIDSLRSE